MKTIDRNELENVNGGVMDSGNGQGCTRSGGCIPNPFPPPRPPITLPGSDGSSQGWPTFGGGWQSGQPR